MAIVEGYVGMVVGSVAMVDGSADTTGGSISGNTGRDRKNIEDHAVHTEDNPHHHKKDSSCSLIVLNTAMPGLPVMANRAVSLFRCQRGIYENAFIAKRHKSSGNYPFTEPAVTPLIMNLLRQR